MPDKSIFTILPFLLLCSCTPLPVVSPPPTLPAIAPSLEEPQPSEELFILAEDVFPEAEDRWFSAASEEASVVSTISNHAYNLEINLAPETHAVLIRTLEDLDTVPEGISVTIAAEGRPFYLYLGVQESDESFYAALLPLHPESGERTVQIDFDWLAISGGSSDENQRLDLDQIDKVVILDGSGFLGWTGPGTLRIASATLWEGNAAPLESFCYLDEFRSDALIVGVDANYIPQGVESGLNWTVDEVPVDPLELFAAQGLESFRLRVWVGDEGESRLDYATELALDAQSAGLTVYPVLFLSTEWADVNSQTVPDQWEEMSLEERAEAIQSYTANTTAHLLAAGLEPPYYEIGNEIDFGISGVFAESGQRSLADLRAETWPEEAVLLKAAIEGVRSVDPGARIMLHIALSIDPVFSEAFFTTMMDLGVPYDIIGLSYYPAAFGPLASAELCLTLDSLRETVGLPIVFAEFAYPAEVPTGGPFGSWRSAVPGYPLTSEGQAAWLATFLGSLRSRSDVIAAYYFSPEFSWSGELWTPFALFDEGNSARPALGSFSSP